MKHNKQVVTPLPDLKAFINPLGNTIPISRGYFTGNSLDFSITGSNLFTVFNTFSWPDSATAGLGTKINVIAGTIGGLTVDDTTAQVFYCDGSVLNNTFKCKLSGTAQTLPVGTDGVFVQEATPYDQNDKGIIAVTSNGPDAGFHLFNVNGFYKSTVISGHDATPENTHYQRIDNMYTVWTVHGDDSTVKVYYYVDQTLTPKNPIVIDAALLGRDALDFCPVSVQANASNQGQTFILAQCPGEESRIFTVNVNGKGAALVVTLDSSKGLNNPKIGSGPVKVCSLGQEHIIQKTSGNKAISSTDNENANTYIGLDVQKNLGTDNVNLMCIRGSQNFLIVTDPSLPGDQTFAAMWGNRAGNLANRYHSVNKLTGDLAGYKVKRVTWNLDGYTLELASGNKQKFMTVLLDGPNIVYTGDEIKQTEITVVVKALGIQVGTPKFKIQIDAFKPEVAIEAKKSGSKPVKGVNNLQDLVNITGPIFNVELDKGTAKADVTLTGAVAVDADYKPKVDYGLVPPTRIKSDKNGLNIGYGQKSDGVDIYLYKSFTILDNSFFLKNLKLNTIESIDCVNTKDVVFGMFGTVNGGVNQLTWFIRDKNEQDKEKVFTGVVEGIDMYTTDIRVVNTVLNRAVVLLNDQVNKKALVLVVEPTLNGNDWSVDILEGFSFNDCKWLILFLIYKFSHTNFLTFKSRCW